MSGKYTKRKEPFNIPTFHESVKRDYEAGLITVEGAAQEFKGSGWRNFIDIDYTERKLGISQKRNDLEAQAFKVCPEELNYELRDSIQYTSDAVLIKFIEDHSS